MVKYLDPISYIVKKVGKNKVQFGGVDVNMKKYSECCINFQQFIDEKMMSVKEAENIGINQDLLKLMVLLAYKNMLIERLDYFRDRVKQFLANFEPTKDIVADYEKFSTLMEGDLFKDRTDFKSLSWKLYSSIYIGQRKFGYTNE
jgi:hypothetical protein